MPNRKSGFEAIAARIAGEAHVKPNPLIPSTRDDAVNEALEGERVGRARTGLTPNRIPIYTFLKAKYNPKRGNQPAAWYGIMEFLADEAMTPTPFPGAHGASWEELMKMLDKRTDFDWKKFQEWYLTVHPELTGNYKR